MRCAAVHYTNGGHWRNWRSATISGQRASVCTCVCSCVLAGINRDHSAVDARTSFHTETTMPDVWPTTHANTFAHRQVHAYQLNNVIYSRTRASLLIAREWIANTQNACVCERARVMFIAGEMREMCVCVSRYNEGQSAWRTKWPGTWLRLCERMRDALGKELLTSRLNLVW